MAKKPCEVRHAEDKQHEEIDSLVAKWEEEIDDELDEQAIPAGGLFEYDLLCPKGTDAGVTGKAVKKLKKLYEGAGWKDIRVGECVNAVHIYADPVAHLTLGIPLDEVKKDEVKKKDVSIFGLEKKDEAKEKAAKDKEILQAKEHEAKEKAAKDKEILQAKEHEAKEKAAKEHEAK